MMTNFDLIEYEVSYEKKLLVIVKDNAIAVIAYYLGYSYL